MKNSLIKKALSLVLTLIMILSIIPLAKIELNASTNGKTQADAIAWCESQLGQCVHGGECVGFVYKYYQFLGQTAGGNAVVYQTSNVPSGWQRIYVTSTTELKKGDIAVDNLNNGFCTGTEGHVSVIAEDVPANQISNVKVYQQNSSIDGTTYRRYVTKDSWYTKTAFHSVIRPDFTPAVPTTGIAFNCGEMTLTIGQMICFTVTIYPSNATDRSVTYSSSNTAVATVDRNGYVKGISAGTAYITATASGGQTATRKVTIVSSSVATTGIMYNHADITIDIGGQAWFKVTVTPADATDKTVTWASSDTSVATVDSNGVVRGVSAGTAVITATASGGQTATRFIVVFPANSATPVCTETYNGHTYALYDYATSWTDAKAFCEAKGGYLATITSANENAFIYELMKNGIKDRYLIGATDSETEGVWKWVNGESFAYSFFSNTEDVNNPLRDSEDWLFVNNQSLWGDMTNYGNPSNHGFICEYDTADDTGEWEYDIVNGSLTITGYNGSADNLEIPVSIDGYPVTAIDESAFVRCTTLESVTIPQGVTTIGDYAFARCTSLDSITIPKSVAEIGEDVFSYCSSFGTIYGYTGSFAEDFAIDNGYNFISLNAEAADEFDYDIENNEIIITCYNGSSTELIIPTTIDGKYVTKIDDIAFTRCIGITSIILPNHIEKIGDYAFSRCTNLESVTIPASVTEIGINIFSRCPAFTTVYGYLDTAAQEYAEINDYNFVYLDTIVSGDMNKDGECDFSDYAMMKTYIGGSNMQLTNYQKISTDINADGAYDAFDLFYIDRIANSLV